MLNELRLIFEERSAKIQRKKVSLTIDTKLQNPLMVQEYRTLKNATDFEFCLFDFVEWMGFSRNTLVKSQRETGVSRNYKYVIRSLIDDRITVLHFSSSFYSL